MRSVHECARALRCARLAAGCRVHDDGHVLGGADVVPQGEDVDPVEVQPAA